MHKTFDELGFKAGDRVRCTESELCTYTVGEVYTLHSTCGRYLTCGGTLNGYSGSWELIEEKPMFDPTNPAALNRADYIHTQLKIAYYVETERHRAQWAIAELHNLAEAMGFDLVEKNNDS